MTTTSKADRARKLVTGVLLRGLTSWRRSIRTRVVVSIVVLSAIVVGGIGWLVMQQITEGLVDGQVKSSVAEATAETRNARDRLGVADGNNFDPETQLRQLVESLVARGEDRDYDVVVLGPIGDAGSTQPGVRSTPGVTDDAVPERLRDAVASGSGVVWTYTSVESTHESGDGAGSRRTRVPGVAVGARVVLPSDGGSYGVYYLFSMDEEQRTLDLLRGALLTAGTLLLALIAAVAWMVTRQVITPVRMARRVAERIASGRLEERMHVSGEDDIARLAISFNSMAESLQQQIRQLVELSRVQRTFVSDVSHELRTPLTTVRMAGDVLYDARDRFDPVTARAAELLQNELDRFENLLADLLEISRFDAGAAALDLENVDLGDIARRVVEATSPLAMKRGVRVSIESDGPCVAEVDPRRIERVVRNLVTNAIDHAHVNSADEDRVVIRLGADENAVALSVRDFGIGLEPGQQSMVFNRFWRADPARARTSGGTGLGLSIAREDAQLHGGWLQAWGAPGEGAVFRMTLPRRAGDELEHSPLPLAPDQVTVG